MELVLEILNIKRFLFSDNIFFMFYTCNMVLYTFEFIKFINVICNYYKFIFHFKLTQYGNIFVVKYIRNFNTHNNDDTLFYGKEINNFYIIIWFFMCWNVIVWIFGRNMALWNYRRYLEPYCFQKILSTEI